MDAHSIAFELYGVDPEEFTAARDQRSDEARRAGDPALAKSIKQLRRPTTAAWLVNLVARQEPDRLSELTDVGEALRRAQSGVARDELRRLDRQRRDLLAQLERLTAEIGRDQGVQVSDAVSAEISGTLVAAVADPGAGEAVRAGMLARALAYSGFGAAVPADSVAAPAGPVTSRPRASTTERSRKGPKRSPDDAEIKEALAAVTAAQAAVTPRRRTVRELEERAEGLRRQLEQLDRHRSALKADAATAQALLRAARKEHDAASSRLQRAERRLATARSRSTSDDSEAQ